MGLYKIWPRKASPHPRAPKSPKSLKKVFPGLPARSVKKLTTRAPNTDFDTFLALFRVLSLIFFSLAFWIFLLLSFEGILAFIFCFFSKDFRGSPARKNACCFCGFFLVFRNGKEKKIRVGTCSTLFWHSGREAWSGLLENFLRKFRAQRASGLS